MAAALRVNGLKVGDRVAGRNRVLLKYFWLPTNYITAIVTNSFNAVIIALATATIGGIFSSTATDMGTQVSKKS
jgi:acetoacetyl-CoA synthetase